MVRGTRKQFQDENGIHLEIGEGIRLTRKNWKHPPMGKCEKTGEVRSSKSCATEEATGTGWKAGEGVGKVKSQFEASESGFANIVLCSVGQSEEVRPNSQRKQ